MLTFLGAACALLFLLTLRVRDRLPLSNLGYALLGFGLLNAGLAQRHGNSTFMVLLATMFTAAGAVLLVYAWLVRKEIRNFRESLLPK